MSDDSIISEEILIEESLEEDSDAYASAYDFEELTNDQQKSRTNLSVSFSSKVEHFQHDLHTKIDSDDEYSSSFDEDLDDVPDAYSNDFENELTQSQILRQSVIPTTSACCTDQPNNPPEMMHDVPLIEIEALQAELALQKLSKEIVFLRNRQRESLQQRRKEVFEKKKRADERRKAHAEELINLRASEERLLADLSELRSANETLKVSLRSAEASRTLVDENLQECASTIDAQSAEISELRNTVVRLESTIAANKKDFSDSEAAWLCAKAELERSLLENRSEVALLTKNIESAESRFEKERNTLPAHHQQILEERLRHISHLEDSLLKREDALKVEQERNRQLLDLSRAEAQADFERKRSTLREELATEKAVVTRAQESLRREKREMESMASLERSQLDSWRLDVVKREHQLAEKEVELDRDRTELLISKQMIEPDLKLSHQNRLQATVVSNEAERLLAVAKEEMAAVRRAEACMEDRERRVRTSWEELEAAKMSFNSLRQTTEAKCRAQSRNQNILKEERRKLHACATELSRQFAKLQKTVTLARKMGLYHMVAGMGDGDEGDSGRIFSDGIELKKAFGCEEIAGGLESSNDSAESEEEGSVTPSCDDQRIGLHKRHMRLKGSSKRDAPPLLRALIKTLASEPLYHSGGDMTLEQGHLSGTGDTGAVLTHRTPSQPLSPSWNFHDMYEGNLKWHDELDGDNVKSSTAITDSRRGKLLDSLDYSALSIADTNMSQVTTLVIDAPSNSGLSGVKASTEAMKSAALKYGITI